MGHDVAGGGMRYENLDMYVQIFVTRHTSHRGGNREEVQFNHVVAWTYLPARDCLDFVSRAVKGEIKVRWLHNAREDIEAVEYNKAPAIQCY